MRCEAFEPQLSAYADGELSPAAAEAVARHLRACGSCAVRLEELLRLKAAIDAANVAESASLAPRIMERIAAERIGTERAGDLRWRGARRVWWWRAAGACAALVAIAVVGRLALRGPEAPPPSVDRLIAATVSVYGEVGQAFAAAGRGIAAAPTQVARDAWFDVASNAPAPGFGDAVEAGRRLIASELAGMGSLVDELLGPVENAAGLR